MIKSYFKTTIRFLMKNKAFSFINIMGLSFGTLCCLYILLYVKDQYSYDRNFDHAKDIYRVTSSVGISGEHRHHASNSPVIVSAMKKDFPEVLQFTRIIPTLGANEHLLTYKEKSFYEKDAYLVDSSFFELFNFHFTAGNPAHALSTPNSIVLLAPVAARLFGKEDPLGKTISINDAWGRNLFTVTGVVDESLGKSSIHANMFIKMNPDGFGGDILTLNVWSGNNFAYCFVKLKPGANAAGLEKKLPAFMHKYGAEQLKNDGMTKELHLQPLTDIHTYSGYDSEMTKTVSSSFLNILVLIAVLIQVIACINFMNLATARASKRAKEVGLRKVVGASRSSMVFQFLGESFLLSLASVLITLPLLALALPYLNQITHADLRLSMLANYQVLFMLLLIVIITGLAAGSYPAFYLSGFQAIKVIKGNFTSHISAAGIRRALVVFQFSLSIMLITSIIVILAQLHYIKNKDLGFDKEQQIIFSFHTDDTKSKIPVFTDDLRKLAEVKNLCRTSNYPGASYYNDGVVFLAGGNTATGIDPQFMNTDEQFIKTMGIPLISGRDFRQHDTTAVIINEILAKRLGLSVDAAPGTVLYGQDGNKTYRIAGVMKDFHYKSLRDKLSPFMVINDPNRYDINCVIVSTSSGNYASLLKKIEAAWRKDLPGTPFDYMFLNDEVQKLYEAEITISHIINSFTLMAIFISCLGLFGLAAFSAEQRGKEIGIRKVLGASVPGIVGLLSKDFLKLVVIAFLIATPVAWWAMDKWLQAFAYKIALSWWMFVLAGILAVLITLFTISFQAVKAALMNPVRSLRSE